MTKIKFLILGFYFFFILYQPFDLWSQNSMQILYGSYIKCKSVQNGYFEMNRHLKFMMSKDTVKSSYKCYFKKLMSDSIYSFIFHSNISFNGIYMGEALYTGEDFILTFIKDSTATIRSASKCANELKMASFNYKFFEPITNRQSFPFMDSAGRFEHGSLIEYLGKEFINKVLCYHLVISRNVKNFSAQSLVKVLDMIYDYWISLSDSIPLTYSVLSKNLIANDTLIQYEKYTLTNYKVNQLLNDSILTLKSIPDFYKISSNNPDEKDHLLLTNSFAPEWSLISLKE